jgi:hypothetical protein
MATSGRRHFPTEERARRSRSTSNCAATPQRFFPRRFFPAFLPMLPCFLPRGPPVSATLGTGGSGSPGAVASIAGVGRVVATGAASATGVTSAAGFASVGDAAGSGALVSVLAAGEAGAVEAGDEGSSANKTEVATARPKRGSRFMPTQRGQNSAKCARKNVRRRNKVPWMCAGSGPTSCWGQRRRAARRLLR